MPIRDGGEKQGVYFQYWDPVKKAPAYNDGPNGLERLDYVLAKAGELDIKIIVVMVNNWRAFGGIDQYLMWYGRDKHHEFFTAPELKQAYKNWVEHVVMRTNTIDGQAVSRRSDDLLVGARQRAALQGRQRLRPWRRLDDDHHHELGRRDEHVHQVARFEPHGFGR